MAGSNQSTPAEKGDAGREAPAHQCGALKTQLQGWATTLDNFNNGLIGPGHCDD